MKTKKYSYSAFTDIRVPGTVYMTLDVVKKVCEILNNKEVEL